MSGDGLWGVIKLLMVFSLTLVLMLYLGTAIFAVATHLGDKYAPSTFGKWVEFIHGEAIWVTLFVSPFVVVATIVFLLPAYLLTKRHR